MHRLYQACGTIPICSAPVFPRRTLFLAATLGLLAEPALRAGRGIPAADLRPLYLREAHIRRPGP